MLHMTTTGRSVLLEHWNKTSDGGSSVSGGKHMTHMISCRGSDIFLHALGVGKSLLSDALTIDDDQGILQDCRMEVSLTC